MFHVIPRDAVPAIADRVAPLLAKSIDRCQPSDATIEGLIDELVQGQSFLIVDDIDEPRNAGTFKFWITNRNELVCQISTLGGAGDYDWQSGVEGMVELARSRGAAWLIAPGREGWRMKQSAMKPLWTVFGRKLNDG